LQPLINLLCPAVLIAEFSMAGKFIDGMLIHLKIGNQLLDYHYFFFLHISLFLSIQKQKEVFCEQKINN